MYNQFLAKAQLDDEGRTQRTKKLREEILARLNQRQQVEADLANRQREVANCDERLDELRDGRARILDADPTSEDTLPFAIAAVGVLLLTLFIFYFYFLVGHTAFEGLATGSRGPFDALQLRQALRGNVVLPALLPVLFLGLGMLIHTCLDAKPPRPGLVAGLVSFTFAADALMGFLIVRATHQAAFNVGTGSPWPDAFGAQLALVRADPTFYLVLLLGFVAYLIWGGLLHYVITKNREMQPDRITGRQLADNEERRIAQLKTRTDALNETDKLRSRRQELDNEIAHKQTDALRYESGEIIPIDHDALRADVYTFLNGWNAYVTFWYTNGDAAAQRIDGARTQTEQWLTRTLAALPALS